VTPAAESAVLKSAVRLLAAAVAAYNALIYHAHKAAWSFSPDSRYIAYTSNETGKPEIYVMAAPPATGKWLISTDGGGMAAWRGDGRELFYLSEDLKMMTVDINPGPPFQASTPKFLFQTGVTGMNDARNNYVVNRDGSRFLILSPNSGDAGALRVIVNWPLLLKN